MKKNITMRVASALGVAVLLTTCGISGTFAKYTTTGTSTSTARVAKWGVVVSATSEMFKESYNTTIGDTSTAVTVKADSEAAQRNLVAPGTSGTLAKATISGKPEVKVEVTYTGEVTLANWTLADNSTYYCPLRVTVNGTEYYGMGYDDSDAFEKAIEDAINATANKQLMRIRIFHLRVQLPVLRFLGNGILAERIVSKPMRTIPFSAMQLLRQRSN